MIYKNQKLGTTEGVTVIQMGTGDVRMDVMVYDDNAKCQGVSLVLKNVEPHPIGQLDITSAGQSVDEIAPDVYFDFTRVESIDVLIERLELAKSLFVVPEEKVAEAAE